MSTQRSGRLHRLIDRALSRIDRRRLVDFALAMILLAVVIIGIIILLGPQLQPIYKNIDNSPWPPTPYP